MGQGPTLTAVGPVPLISRFFVEGINVRGPGCYVMQADGSTSSTSIVSRSERSRCPESPLLSGDPPAPARPFDVPAVLGACPVGPVSTREGAGSGLGSGAVFLVGDDQPVSLTGSEHRPGGSGWALNTVWVNTDSAARPVVIRGARRDAVGTVRFEGGLNKGTQGFLYLGGDTGVSSGGMPPAWQQWPVTAIFPGPGCYLFQVDGVDFTERLVIEVTG